MLPHPSSAGMNISTQFLQREAKPINTGS